MKLENMMPFLESEDIKELAIKIINEEVKGIKLLKVFPFLSEKDLDEIINLLIEKGAGKELTYALPFVSKETLSRIYEGVKAGEITNIKEYSFYPFLGKEKIKEMFDMLVKEAESNTDEDSEE